MTQKQPLVSVITPTYDRSSYHERLYRSFAAQTYANKELLVLDDGEKPSEFFSNLKDDRVIYTHSKARMNIGEKRNRLLSLAKGEIIAHFDDDDLYTPEYLTVMAGALEDEYVLVKLASWFTYHEPSKHFFYWNTPIVSSLHFVVQPGQPLLAIKGSEHFDHKFVSDVLWGFGFSYVYRKSLYPEIAFASEDNFGEDIRFIQKIQKAGLLCRALADTQGLAAHVMHGSNTSRIFPQFQLPPFVAERLFPNLHRMAQD